MKQETIELMNDFFSRHEDCKYLKGNMLSAVEILLECSKANKILICGNGGSAADSEHIAGELLKSFVKKRPISDENRKKLNELWGEEGDFLADNMQEGVKCIPLTSFCAYNTAFLNDCNEKLMFAQLVNVLGVSGDVMIAISTSGNSKNVVYAVEVAKAKGMKVIALTGESGGKLKDMADVLLNAPSIETYRIQEYHLPFYHLLCLCLESELFEK